MDYWGKNSEKDQIFQTDHQHNVLMIHFAMAYR